MGGLKYSTISTVVGGTVLFEHSGLPVLQPCGPVEIAP